MRTYRLVIMWLFMLLCVTPVAIAQDTSRASKEQNIRKLLTMTDARGVFKRTIESQFNALKQTVRDVPAKVWDELLKEIDPDKFIELLIPIYDKHFSNDELEGLLVFYETPVGKKFLSELPQIMTESVAVGQQYGQEVATRVIKRMQAEGTFPSAAPPGDEKPPPPPR